MGVGIIVNVYVCVNLMTHDMGQRIPLALDQDRRCQTPGAAQNTAEEVLRREYYDTASKEDRERRLQRGQDTYSTNFILKNTHTFVSSDFCKI